MIQYFKENYMKQQLIKELNNLPELPTNIIELNEFKNEDSMDTQRLMKILQKTL